MLNGKGIFLLSFKKIPGTVVQFRVGTSDQIFVSTPGGTHLYPRAMLYECCKWKKKRKSRRLSYLYVVLKSQKPFQNN